MPSGFGPTSCFAVDSLRSNPMLQLWLQFALVVALALLAWICGLDTNGAPAETASLWGAAALVGANLLYRFLVRSR
jgi:hypothetical protein